MDSFYMPQDIMSPPNSIYLSAQLWITKNCIAFLSVYFFVEVSPGIRLGVTNWIAAQGKHNSPLLNVSLIRLVLIHRWGGCVAFHLNLIIRKALCWTHIIKLPFWRETFVREVISIRPVSGGYIIARKHSYLFLLLILTVFGFRVLWEVKLTWLS